MLILMGTRITQTFSKNRRFKDFDCINLEGQDGTHLGWAQRCTFKYSCNCGICLAQLYIYNVDVSV